MSPLAEKEVGQAELLDAWVEALEGGDYVQGSGALVRVNADGENPRHCCLGVLCVVAEGMGLVEREPRGDHTYDDSGHRNLAYRDADGESISETAILPTELARRVGMTSAGARVEIGGYDASLMNHNDSGMTFASIAGGIREWRDGRGDADGS